MKTTRCAAALAVLVFVMTAIAQADSVPEFRVDPYWPKPLPNNWIFGQIGGIATDRHDHVWVYQRPRTLINPDVIMTISRDAADLSEDPVVR